jgi:outer membrane protein OmpA-like peptidoglycan-associated protein
MRKRITTKQLIAVVFTLVMSTAVFAQDNKSISDGQKLRVEGIVTERHDDTFTLRGPDGTETSVVLTDQTNIKTVRRFQRDKNTPAYFILRGLRLKAAGRGNSDGQLVAKDIRFDERDLFTAQALESRVEPVESQADATEVLTLSNEARIDFAQQRIDQADQNAQRLSGQVEELSSVANAAVASAKNAQTTADQAELAANTANERITRLDDFEVFRTITVHFKSGSAYLSRQAKAEIDEAAANLKDDNLKGWMVSVTGYADSTGKAGSNRSLSDRRANAVIGYLVTKHNVPLQKLVQPFGYGSGKPVETNHTSSGRAQNRRAEINILVSKGVSQASL